MSKAELDAALKDAMRAGDDLRKTTIRMALAAIKQTEIDRRISLDANGIIAVLQKEVKSRREAIAEAEKAGRPELAEAAQREIMILETFLPKAMPDEELAALVRQAIAEVGATSAKEMGAVMKALMPRLQGRAAGDQVSAMVRRLLQTDQ
jgi:hypothetical protein